MAGTPITVDCTKVRKAYRRGSSVATVLVDVDLQVHAGEFIVLAGPSGSGKTTLLSILGCILRPDEGQVRVLGRDVGDLSASELATLRRDRIGFLFQRFHLIRGLSAVENVSVPLLLAGISEREAQRQAAERLAEVGLADFHKKDPRRMSVGQCQRVALARAVVNRPDLILADEPTASLDAESGQAAMKLIRRIVDEEHRTAIIVTHDTRVFKYADHVLELRGGRLLGGVRSVECGMRNEESGGQEAEDRGQSSEDEAQWSAKKAPKVAASPWSILSRDLAARGFQHLSTDN